jgi:predicted ATPase/class 3 adenylate cyclase/DNA-binding CsgD family transcriptional regulator
MRVNKRGTLPTGTVTFLLTDIEGSTRLWQADPDSMSGDVTRHHEILDVAIARRGGVRPLEQGEGDSVVAVFARPSDAIAAGIDAQQALEAEHATGSIRVRMAVHTGEAELRDENNYAGETIIRTARLRDIGHGGQILVSRASADLLADRLPEHVSLLDLGIHRLRDLGRPEHVFQLTHPALQREFPSLRSLNSVPNNLPVQLTNFIGRAAELIELQQQLRNTRLLTLVGSGGCGKTRLAAQLAADVSDLYSDGIWWIDLAATADPDRVGAAVMSAIGLRHAKGLEPAARLCEHLADRHALLIVDNCEHVLDAAAHLIDALLRSGPELHVIATSREALSVPGEISWRVPALSLPPSPEDLAVGSLGMYDAVRLFIDRALRARPNFAVTNELAPVVAEICARLDGIPLAIELAAARVRMMTPEQILGGLDDRFRLLTGGARTLMARQQTLQASVEWSHDLLGEAERILLRRLAVFSGGFSLDAVENVCAGDPIEKQHVLQLVSQLVDKSLITIDEHEARGRYGLLETIRQFGREQLLQAKETSTVRDRHLAFFVDLVERNEPDVERSSPEAFATLEREHDNLRAALEWALASGAGESTLRLAGALSLFWNGHGYYTEGIRWLEQALAGAQPGRASRKASWGLGHLRLFGMDVAHNLGYEDSEAAIDSGGLEDDVRLRTRPLLDQGFVDFWTGKPDAEAKLEDAVGAARANEDEWALGTGLMYLSLIRNLSRDPVDQSRPLTDELAALAEVRGDRLMAAAANVSAAIANDRRGRFAEARPQLERAYSFISEIGDPGWEIYAVVELVNLNIAEGKHHAAREVLAKSTERMQASAPGRIEILEVLNASIEFAEGAAERAVAVLRESGTAVQGLAGPIGIVDGCFRLGQAELALSDLAAAQIHLETGLAVAKQWEMPWFTAVLLNDLGRVARAEDNLESAERSHHEALAIALDHHFSPVIANSIEGLAGLAAVTESYAEAARLLGAGEGMHRAMGLVRSVDSQKRYDADVAAVRTALGNETDALMEEGAALSADGAVAYVRRARGERKRPSAGWASLTPTELQVVSLASEGLSNVAIGSKMFISAGTVKTHLSHIYGKLGISNRAELAGLAARRGR